MIKNKAEKITNIATKRGFFFPTAEIYGSKAGLWTYGHLGKLMKQKFENLWRSYFLGLNQNFYEIEGNSILPKEVFKASGHLEKFNDPLTSCLKCKFRFRADELIEDAGYNANNLTSASMDKLIKEHELRCPKCGSELGKVAWFNMMFDVKLGVTGDDVAYLSPETAQNPYLSFKREFFSLRERLPLGLAMIGKAFRNEISPRQGFFRLREFTQAELQIFFNPDDIDKHTAWQDISRYKLNILFSKDKKVSQLSCNDLNKKHKLPKFYLYYLAKIQEFYLEVLIIPNVKFMLRELSYSEKVFYNNLH